MDISELINNPHKLEEVFKDAVYDGNKEIANLLLDYIDDPNLIYLYARYIVEGKVNDKLEDIIAQDATSSCNYAIYVLKGPFPKGENIIAQYANWSYVYARDALKGPFFKGEDVIAKSQNFSYWYAKDVLKGPFPKGEDVIAQSPNYSFWYATQVLKGPFLKGEDTILKSKYKDKYIDFLKEIGELEEFYKRHPEVKK